MKKTLFIIVIILAVLGCTKMESSNSLDREKLFAKYDSYSIETENLEKILDSAIIEKDRYKEGLVRLALGRRLRNSSQFNKAFNMLKDAQNIAYEIADTLMIIKSYNEIGTVYRRVDALNEAITVHYEALQYSELYSDSTNYITRKQKATALNGIGNISLVLEFYDKAEESFRESIKIEEMLKSDIGLAINYANIGSIYEAKNAADSAMHYFNLSLEHNIKANSTLGMSLCYNNIGRLFEKSGKLTEAKEHYLKGYNNIQNDRDLWHKLILLTSVARIDITQGNYSEGTARLKQAHNYAVEISSPEHLSEIYRIWADYYEKTGKVSLSLDHLKKSYENADAGRRKKEQESLMQTNINFVTELSNEHAELQLAIIQQHKQMQKLLYFTVAICILALIMLVCILSLVRSRNRRLVEANALKDNFVKVISHDIKNPLIAQKSILELMVNNIEYLKVDDIRTQCDDLLRSSSSLLEMLHNLLNWSQIESKTIRYNPVNIDLLASIGEVKEMYYISFAQKRINLEVDCPPNTIINGDYNMISAIIRNLVNNSLKYSHPDSSIRISVADYNSKMLQVTVQDHGVGIKKDVMDKLFKLNAVKTKIGTAGELGTGLGLIIVKQMVEMNGGEIFIASQHGEGTEISFTVNRA